MRAPTATLAVLLPLLGCSPSRVAFTGQAPQIAGRPSQPAVLAQTGKQEPPPPPVDVTREPFPAIQSHELKSGLAIDVIERHALPLVSVTLLIQSGQASDGDHPGAAAVTARLLEAGGAGQYTSQKLRERIDSLGASLSITASRTTITLSLTATRDRLDDCLSILAALVQKPRFDPKEFEQLRQRELERIRSLFRTNGSALARYVLTRELYQQPIGIHPYASIEALPSELERLTLNDCRTFHRQHMTPPNARLLAVGDIVPSDLLTKVQTYFGGWSGPAPASQGIALPVDAPQLRVVVVNRPSSTQSDILIGVLGPRRDEREFPSVATMQQVIGGGVAGRLFRDVREKRSLAYSTGAGTMEVKDGPAVLVFSAGTQTPKTAEAVSAILEHLDRARAGDVEPAELSTAQRFLVYGMPMRWETVDVLGQQLVLLRSLGLSDRHFDELRDQIADASPMSLALARQYYERKRAVVVVAGDAAQIAESLRAFGPVEVLDPGREFIVERKLEPQ